MKKYILFLIAVFSVVIAATGFRQKNQTEKFYYAFNEKKTLTQHPTKLIVRFSGKYPIDSARQNISRIASTSVQKWLRDSLTVIIDAKETGIQTDLLNAFSINNDVVSVNPIYTIDKGAELGITNEFVAQFLNNVSQETIDSLNNVYNVTVIKKSFYYLLRVPEKSNTLQIANTYYETGFTKFSHPNFILHVEPFHIPNDTYFNEQWNFYNTGQTINDGHVGTPGADIKATQAWDITKGSSSITIAVLDEGVTSNHPDLPNSRQVRLNGSNFADGNVNDPSPNGTTDNHGNACAGVIAATQDNNEGITGLAPNCKILPVKIFNGDETGIANNLLADAITFAYTNGADIISNSWGFPGVTDPNAIPVIVTAIQNATTQGRYMNGIHYGCVVVFAAGNTAIHSAAINGVVEFPANVNVSGVLTVGASDRNDEQADYSPTSDPNSNQNQLIDVVAPSHRAYPPAVYLAQGIIGGIAGETFEVWSIDMPSIPLGYNEWPNVAPYNLENTPGEELPNTGTNFEAYTGRFGGTSAACPQVAGLAALILSVNPNLTQQQVYNIITSTADKVGGYTYNNGFSNEMGYGRINACSALIQTQALSDIINISGDAIVCSTSGLYTINNLPNGASVTWSASPTYTVTINSPNSPQTTITKIANGTITLTAAISNVCGNSIVYITKQVQVGLNTPSFVVNALNYCQGTHFTAIATSNNPGQPISSYNWFLDGSPQSYTGFKLTGTFPSDNNYMELSVSTTNCGTSDIYYVPDLNCNGGFDFIIAPNPASNTVTITTANTGTTDTTTNMASRNSIVSKTTTPAVKAIIKQVKIVDVGGRLMKQMDYSTAQQQVIIDVSALKPGIYFVSISDGKNILYKKMVIQR